jgi:Flp pilus assembly protein TadG
VLPTVQGMGRFSRGVIADGGAAALEFALVVPVLAVLVFGMIDYGLFFTDSLGARDGARVAARDASIEHFVGACPDGYSSSGDAELAQAACEAVDQTSAIGGDTYVKVSMPHGWVHQQPLIVCVAVVENGLTGLTPMPNNSTVRARLEVLIEQDASPSEPSALAAEAKRTSADEPSNLWDNWCDDPP